MKEFLEIIVKKLVEDVDSISITEREEERGKVLELKVASADMGKVIGKEGRIAKAIRTIIRAIAIHNSEHYFVEISEKTED